MSVNPRRFSSRQQSRSLRRDLSLRTVLIVPFVVQVAAAVGLVGYFSFRNSQQAVNNLAYQLINEVNNRVDQHLNDYLSSARKLAKLNGDSITTKPLETENIIELQQDFWRQTKIYQPGFVLYGDIQGKFTSSGYIFEDDLIEISEILPKFYGNSNVYSYATDSQGKKVKYTHDPIPYDFQKEGWYAETLKAKKPIWTSIYAWEFPPYPLAIAYGYPIYDKNQQLIGSVGVEQRLSQVSSFLKTIQGSPSMKIFILERDGLLVADSSAEKPFKLINDKAVRIEVTASGDPLIQATAQYLKKEFGEFQNIQGNQQLWFWHNGQKQFVQLTSWQDVDGLDWLVVIAVPESDFMAQINANNQTTILLCLLALMVAIALGLFTTRWIVGLILKLRDASQAIAEGNLEETLEIQGITELKDLAIAFNQMGGQLKEYFHNLEDLVEGRTNELQQTLEDLKKTQSQLIQSEKMSSLGQLVAGVAHEINNPVGFIHGNLRYARDYTNQLLKLVAAYQFRAAQLSSKVSPEPLSEPLSKPSSELEAELEAAIEEIDVSFIEEDLPKLFISMQKGTERIQSIVESLRTFSRLGESTLKTIDLNHSLDSTLVLLHHRFIQEDSRDTQGESPINPLPVEIKKDYAELPPIKCYAGQINQVFMNILANALDALEDYAASNHEPDWRGEIQISTQMVGSDRIRITIADNAAGIPPEFQERVFDPFFTTKPVGKGTGLGMAVSYQTIVQGHKGSLSFHPVVPHGTEFMIEIPIQA